MGDLHSPHPSDLLPEQAREYPVWLGFNGLELFRYRLGQSHLVWHTGRL